MLDVNFYGLMNVSKTVKRLEKSHSGGFPRKRNSTQSNRWENNLSTVVLSPFDLQSVIVALCGGNCQELACSYRKTLKSLIWLRTEAFNTVQRWINTAWNWLYNLVGLLSVPLCCCKFFNVICKKLKLHSNNLWICIIRFWNVCLKVINSKWTCFKNILPIHFKNSYSNNFWNVFSLTVI